MSDQLNDVELDSLHEQDVLDNEALDKAAESDLVPVGQYVSNPEELGEGTWSKITIDEKNGDGEVKGQRKIYTVLGLKAQGRVTAKDGSVSVEEVFIPRFQFSPDIRNKVNFVTKEVMRGNDLRSKLFLQARDAYKAQFNEYPKTAEAVAQFLVNNPVRFTVGHWGSPKAAQVASISPVRKK